MKKKAQRRQFTVKFKRRILKKADAAKAPGEIGSLLRREGLYSSHLSTWRAARERGELAPGATAKRRGPKPDLRDKRIAELERQIKSVTKRAGMLSPKKVLKDGGVDSLLFALNIGSIVSIPADEKLGQEESRIPMGELVQEIKAQISFVDRVGADQLMNHLARWSSLPWTVSVPEPNGKLGQQESCIPGEFLQDLKPQFAYVDCPEVRALMADAPMADFFFRYGRHDRLFQKVQLERGLGLSYDIETNLSRTYDRGLDLAIEQLFKLAERRMLGYLKQCGVCRQRWYLATRFDQISCSKTCRQKKYCSTPEHNRRRRANYEAKKTEQRKLNGKLKAK